MLCAVHEASHVVANLVIGFRVEHAQVDGGAHTRRSGTWRNPGALGDLITHLAGAVGESLYSGEHLLDVLREGGAIDLERARAEAVRLAALGLYKTPDHALLAAEAKARELLLKHWGFVIDTARELHRHGRID